MVQFKTFAAPFHVRHIVSNFWCFESDEGVGAYTHYATATVFPKLVFGLEGCFSLSSDEGRQIQLNGSGFNGQMNTFMKLVVNSKKVSVFGVVLNPSSLLGLTGHTAERLNNEYVDFISLWSTVSRHLEERVVTAPDHHTRIEIVSSFLEEMWSRNERSRGGGYFDQAHFIKDFKQFSGFTPRTY